MVYRKRRVSKRAKPMRKTSRRKYSSRKPRYNKPDVGYSEKIQSQTTMYVAGDAAYCNVQWNMTDTTAS